MTPMAVIEAMPGARTAHTMVATMAAATSRMIAAYVDETNARVSVDGVQVGGSSESERLGDRVEFGRCAAEHRARQLYTVDKRVLHDLYRTLEQRGGRHGGPVSETDPSR
jgi:hypothetical protein